MRSRLEELADVITRAAVVDVRLRREAFVDRAVAVVVDAVARLDAVVAVEALVLAAIRLRIRSRRVAVDVREAREAGRDLTRARGARRLRAGLVADVAAGAAVVAIRLQIK